MNRSKKLALEIYGTIRYNCRLHGVSESMVPYAIAALCGKSDFRELDPIDQAIEVGKFIALEYFPNKVPKRVLGKHESTTLSNLVGRVAA